MIHLMYMTAFKIALFVNFNLHYNKHITINRFFSMYIQFFTNVLGKNVPVIHYLMVHVDLFRISSSNPRFNNNLPFRLCLVDP